MSRCLVGQVVCAWSVRARNRRWVCRSALEVRYILMAGGGRCDGGDFRVYVTHSLTIPVT